MLLYGKMVKLAELSRFLTDFGSPQKMFLVLKFEALDQTKLNFGFLKQQIFLTSPEKDTLVQHHLGCKKWQKHWRGGGTHRDWSWSSHSHQSRLGSPARRHTPTSSGYNPHCENT